MGYKTDIPEGFGIAWLNDDYCERRLARVKELVARECPGILPDGATAS